MVSSLSQYIAVSIASSSSHSGLDWNRELRTKNPGKKGEFSKHDQNDVEIMPDYSQLHRDIMKTIFERSQEGLADFTGFLLIFKNSAILEKSIFENYQF